MSSSAVAFDDDLRDRVTANLAAHRVREHPLDGRRHAAVAVVLIDSDAELHGADDTDINRVTDLSTVPGNSAHWSRSVGEFRVE